MEQQIGALVFTGLISLTACVLLVRALVIRTGTFFQTYMERLFGDMERMDGAARLTKWSKRPRWLWWAICGAACLLTMLVSVPISFLIGLLSYWMLASTLIVISPSTFGDLPIFTWDVVTVFAVSVLIFQPMAVLSWFWQRHLGMTELFRLSAAVENIFLRAGRTVEHSLRTPRILNVHRP